MSEIAKSSAAFRVKSIMVIGDVTHDVIYYTGGATGDSVSQVCKSPGGTLVLTKMLEVAFKRTENPPKIISYHRQNGTLEGLNLLEARWETTEFIRSKESLGAGSD